MDSPALCMRRSLARSESVNNRWRRQRLGRGGAWRPRSRRAEGAFACSPRCVHPNSRAPVLRATMASLRYPLPLPSFWAYADLAAGARTMAKLRRRSLPTSARAASGGWAVTGAVRAREGLTLLGVYAMRDEAISLASQGSEISFPRSKGFSAQLRTRHHRSKGGWRGRKGRITFHLAGGTICCITGAKTGQELAERDIPVPKADGQGKKTNAVHRNSR